MSLIQTATIAGLGEAELGIIGTIGIIIVGVVFLSYRNKQRSADKQNKEKQNAQFHIEQPTQALLSELLIEAKKYREVCEKLVWPARITAIVMILILFYGFKVVVR